MNGMESWGEPRAWALAWDGEALMSGAWTARPEPAAVEPVWVVWRLQPLQPGDVAARVAASRNGHGSFREPAAWALEWDGLALQGAS